MVELVAQEKLQPSLLDRLTDEKPRRTDESREDRVMTKSALKDAVLRNLVWLMNTTNFETVVNIDDYEEIKTSTLNYGLPDFSGRTKSTVDAYLMERKIQQMIVIFEPRIMKNSLAVKCVKNELSQFNNSIVFEIKGSIWGQPIPQELYLRTELDLELGDMSVIKG